MMPNGYESLALSLTDYRELIARLPRPTPQQMKDFAGYVSTSHSWYKSLICGPPVFKFFFFLDPYAGCELYESEDGRLQAVPRAQAGPHYSDLPGDEYLRRFGHLGYSTEQDARDHTRSAWEYKSHYGRDLLGDGEYPEAVMFSLPKEIVQAGAAEVTAVVHPCAAQPEYWVAAAAQSELSWPQEVGGAQQLDKILRWCHCAVESQDYSVIGLEHSLANENSHYINMSLELAEILKPERNRQLREMVRAMVRMCDLLGTR